MFLRFHISPKEIFHFKSRIQIISFSSKFDVNSHKFLRVTCKRNINPLSANVALILQPVNWFAVQINNWVLYEGNTGT